MARPLKSSAEFRGHRSEWVERAPRANLSGVVAAAWTGAGGWARRLRLLPDGCADLVWNGRELLVIPPRDRAQFGQVEAQSRNVGLRLNCGVASLAASIPYTDDWRLRLLRAREPERQLKILQDLVEQQMADVSVDSPVLRAVERLRASGSLDDAAEAAGLEPRELRRRFASAVGLSPKRLQRVFRFERLLHELGRTADASLAADLGYADQAHMIRECRAIAGSTPRQLARALG